MTIKNKFRSFFSIEEDDFEDYQEPARQPVRPSVLTQVPPVSAATTTRKSKQNVVSLQSASRSNNQAQVILIEPVSYADSQIVADHLKGKRSVVINLHLINEAQSRRILDFLSGHIYAINGDIQRVGANIFICTPDSVEITGAISAYENEFDEDQIRWQ